MRWVLCFLGLLVFSSPAWAHAAEPLVIEDSHEAYPLGLHLDVLEDPSGALTLDDVLSAEHASRFTPSGAEAPNFGLTRSAYWFRLSLENNSARSNWLIEIEYPPLDQIDFFMLPAGAQPGTKPLRSTATGDLRPFAQRDLRFHVYVFRLPLPPKQKAMVYLRIQTDGSLSVPISLRSPEAFAESASEEKQGLGLYFGVLLALLLYNLFIFGTSRDRGHLFYSLYLLGFCFFIMSVRGLGVQYLWPNSPWWTNVSTPFSVGVTSLSAGLFAQHFLNTKHNAPRLHQLFWLLNAFAGVTVVASLAAGYATSIRFAIVCGSVYPLVSFGTGIVLLRRGHRAARFYLLAWSCLLLGIGIYVLKTVGAIPSNFWTENSLLLGSGLEVILLSFALADRFNLMRLDTDLAQMRALEQEKQTRAVFRQSEQRLRTLIDATFDATFVEEDGVVSDLNEGAETLTGHERSELLGTSILNLLDEKDRKRIGSEVNKGRAEVFVADVLRRDGTTFHAEIAVAELLGGDSTTRVIGIRDISEKVAFLQKLEATVTARTCDLEMARADAERANAAKSRFLANMSHELRTPLNAIIGFSEILAEDAVAAGNETLAEDIGKINSSGRLLSGLINEILELSMIEAGKLQLRLEEFDLALLVHEVVTSMEPLVKENSNRIEIDVPEDAGVMHSDQQRVRQVLMNLISNSAKFTEAGSITVSVEPARERVRLSVRDTGIGMTEEQRERLFQDFTQVHDRGQRDYGGTGLGLAICRRYCRLLGGDITVESEPGEGSCFTVDLPRRAPS